MSGVGVMNQAMHGIEVSIRIYSFSFEHGWWRLFLHGRHSWYCKLFI